VWCWDSCRFVTVKFLKKRQRNPNHTFKNFLLLQQSQFEMSRFQLQDISLSLFNLFIYHLAERLRNVGSNPRCGSVSLCPWERHLMPSWGQAVYQLWWLSLTIDCKQSSWRGMKDTEQKESYARRPLKNGTQSGELTIYSKIVGDYRIRMACKCNVPLKSIIVQIMTQFDDVLAFTFSFALS